MCEGKMSRQKKEWKSSLSFFSSNAATIRAAARLSGADEERTNSPDDVAEGEKE